MPPSPAASLVLDDDDEDTKNKIRIQDQLREVVRVQKNKLKDKGFSYVYMVIASNQQQHFYKNILTFRPLEYDSDYLYKNNLNMKFNVTNKRWEPLPFSQLSNTLTVTKTHFMMKM